MTKYQEYYSQMLTQNQEIFDTFRTIHTNYIINPDAWQEKLNTVGAEVMDIIKNYENRLCSHSEGSQYGKYSTSLSEKFWTLIRREFPKIDFVGIKRS